MCDLPLLLVILTVPIASCKTPAVYRQEADEVAYSNIASAQQEAFNKTEQFSIEPASETLRKRLLTMQGLPISARASLGSDELQPVEHWPDTGAGREDAPENPVIPPWRQADPLALDLMEALQVGARNSREYQTRKEEVFRTALTLDLERNEFRNIFAGLIEGLLDVDESSADTVSATRTTAEGSVSRRLKSGAELLGRIGVDLVRLLTQGGSSSLGVFADATVAIPLLRGSGKWVVTEPLQQAERDMIYAIWDFEHFKRTFAVDVASAYLDVLQAKQEVRNAEENYRGLIISTRRARRLAESGQLPGFQYDQALQNELRSRNRWISAQQNHANRLDAFKFLIGLPVDARVSLDDSDLSQLAATTRAKLNMDAEREEPVDDAASSTGPAVILRQTEDQQAGPLEMEMEDAIEIALENRLDLRTAIGRVFDAQRKVAVAADALRAELTLFGTANFGERRGVASADLDDASLDFSEGQYSALLTLDLPLERTAERNAFRDSYIRLERAVRDVQALEDRVKLGVRSNLRTLLESRESIGIQAMSVSIAERRVKSTELFLQAGRAEVRDLLDSQEALISSQNALTSALVNYRIAELELQRDLGVLEVNEQGLWSEISPN